MRLARKLFLLAAAAVVALALTAPAASAQLQVYAEPGDECPTVTKVDHEVTGGCHIEVATSGHVTLVAFVPQRVVLTNCEAHLGGRIGGDGQGWVTDITLTSENPPTDPPCTRMACDEANSTTIPWPVNFVENGPGDEWVESTFCLRTVASGPGGSGSQCEVHLEHIDLGGHEYDLGGSPSSAQCETSPSPPAVIAIESDGFILEEDSEHIEIVH